MNFNPLVDRIINNQFQYRTNNFMGDKSQISTSLEFRNNGNLDDYLIDVTNGLTSEIAYYKSAMENLEKMLTMYQEENTLCKSQNERLVKKTGQLENNLREVMKKLIKYESQKSKALQMQEEISVLNRKLETYERTIEILEDKLLILNVAIRKQEHFHKYPQSEMGSPLAKSFYNKTHLVKTQSLHEVDRDFIKTPKYKQNQAQKQQNTTASFFRTPIKVTQVPSTITSNIKRMKRVQTQRCEYSDKQLSSLSSKFT